jgi:hypothetical protein
MAVWLLSGCFLDNAVHADVEGAGVWVTTGFGKGVAEGSLGENGRTLALADHLCCTSSPVFRQGKAIVGIHHHKDCLVETLLGDVALMCPGEVAPINYSQRSHHLGRPQQASIAEHRGKIECNRVLELALVPGNRAKAARPVEPVLGVTQGVENANRRDLGTDRRFELGK